MKARHRSAVSKHLRTKTSKVTKSFCTGGSAHLLHQCLRQLRTSTKVPHATQPKYKFGSRKKGKEVTHDNNLPATPHHLQARNSTQLKRKIMNFGKWNNLLSFAEARGQSNLTLWVFNPFQEPHEQFSEEAARRPGSRRKGGEQRLNRPLCLCPSPALCFFLCLRWSQEQPKQNSLTV